MPDDKEIRLEDRGIFLFMGDVDDELCRDAIEFIMLENILGKQGHLTLVINSNGGSTHAGFALVDTIAGSKIPVHTVGIGILASMALDIFIAGEKGYRTLTPNTMIMSHQYSWGTWGKEHELLASIKAFGLMEEITVRHYKKHTGMSEKDIKKYLMPPSDVWLSAKEAKKLGLCDIIKDFN